MTKIRSEAALYELHRADLVRFAAAVAGTSDAGDVVSDAMVALLRSGRLAEADNPRALMYRAVLIQARSMHRSVFRRRARERRFAGRLIAENPELRPDVFAAVTKLSPQQRACVYLIYWEDLSPNEVAARLGIGEGTVKKYLARARSRLREVLDE